MRPIKTLERVLSKAGLGSRTEARKWIAGGRVKVNGRVVTDPDQWIDLERDRVAFDNKPLRLETTPDGIGVTARRGSGPHLGGPQRGT